MNLASIGRSLFVSKQPEKKEPKYSASPSPEDMLRARLPEKSYQGLKVAWNLTFEHLHCEISHDEVLALTTDKQQLGKIWITVDGKKYPDIYYCLPGNRVIVKGEITSIQGEDIYLKDCQLES